MMLRVISGTVLNQDSDYPMSGEIVGWRGDYLHIRWFDGKDCDEWPSDVTLTGDVKFEEVNDESNFSRTID